MSESRDVLIRHLNAHEFVVVDATTRELVAGPFDRFSIALTAAREAADDNAVWYEDLDHHGRPLKPIRLPSLLS